MATHDPTRDSRAELPDPYRHHTAPTADPLPDPYARAAGTPADEAPALPDAYVSGPWVGAPAPLPDAYARPQALAREADELPDPYRRAIETTDTAAPRLPDTYEHGVWAENTAPPELPNPYARAAGTPADEAPALPDAYVSGPWVGAPAPLPDAYARPQALAREADELPDPYRRAVEAPDTPPPGLPDTYEHGVWAERTAISQTVDSDVHQQSPREQVEQVTNNLGIQRLLQRLHEQHTILAVTLDGEHHSYSSVLLDQNLSGQYLLLDELSPADGHLQIYNANYVHIKSQISGVRINFSCEVHEVHGQAGIAYYKIGWPRHVNYYQRRNDYRIDIDADYRVPITLAHYHEHLYFGVVRDISAGGVGARINRTNPQILRPGEQFSSCSIQLPDKKTIHSKLELRFAAEQKMTDNTLVGACFLDLSHYDQNAIRHFINQLDREIMKKRAVDENAGI